MGREKQLIKNTMVLGIGNILPKLATFITLPLYTAILTKAEYGTYDLITILTSLVAPAVTLQIQTAAFRFLIGEKEKKTIKTIITNVLLFVIPISLITLIVIFLCLHTLDTKIRILISAYLFLEIYLNVIQQILRGLGRVKEFAISAIINTIANLVIVLPLLLWMNLGLDGLILSLCTAIIIAVLYINRYIQLLTYFDIKLFEWNCLKKLLKYSCPMVPNAMSMWIVSASDRLVISATLGVEANAVYAVATKFPQVLTIVQSTFTMAWQESASIANEDKDSSQYYNLVFDGLIRALSGIMALLIGFMPVLFSLFVNGAYEEAYVQMPILFMAMLFYGLSAYYGGIYVAQMKTTNAAISTIIAALINLIINILFIHSIGIYAASISTLVSYVFLTVYRAINTSKIRPLEYKWKNIVFYLIILIIMSILFYSNEVEIKIVNLLLGVVFAVVINKKLLIGLYITMKQYIKKSKKG